jgi:hypothetical protein
MSSAIDPTLPADGVPAVKADLRANLAAAKGEIEALQARQVPAGGAAGSVLAKASGDDFALGWISAPAAVLIQDEGNDVAGAPHAVLNFSGPGVAVSDSGGGKATISISGAPGANFPGFAFASDFLAASSSADQHEALNSFFDQARNNGKHLIFDQGPTTYFTSRTHCFGRADFEGGSARAAIHRTIIDFGGCEIKAHGVKSLGSQFERRAILHFVNCSRITLKNGRLDNNRQEVTSGQNEFKPACLIAGDCHDWTIENMWFGDCWGDGLELERGDNHDDRPRRLLLTNCVFENAGRNGFTVNFGEDITCIGCQFLGSNGHAPMAGCDIEPWDGPASGDSRDIGARRIRFIACTFADNHGDGLEIFSNDITPNGIHQTFEVLVQGCVFRNNATTQGGRAHILQRGYVVIIDSCQFIDLTAVGDNDTVCIKVQNFSRDLWGETIVSNCIFVRNTGVHRIIDIGPDNSNPAQAYPFLITGCILDGAGMNGSGPLIRVNNGDRVAIKNVTLKGKGSGNTTNGIEITPGAANAVVIGVEAEGLQTIVANGSATTKQISLLTKWADVANFRTGNAAAQEVGWA